MGKNRFATAFGIKNDPSLSEKQIHTLNTYIQTMKTTLYFLSFLLLCTQGFSQTYTGKQKDIASILNNVRLFSTYVVDADQQKLRGCYTEDGKLFPSGRDILEGGEAIERYWTFSGDSKIIAHKITPMEIKVQGKEAYDYGYYEGTTRLANGEEQSWRGKYVIIWRKVGKEWKIYLDIWNRIDG